jgi:hypothetical protein
LLPKSSLNLPSSTRTVKAFVEVEAFALRAEDLKFVPNQFRRGFGFYEIFRWVAERTPGKERLIVESPQMTPFQFFF